MLHYLLTWVRTKREEGQDLAEYALLIALISVALVLVLIALSGGMANIFRAVNAILSNASTQSYTP